MLCIVSTYQVKDKRYVYETHIKAVGRKVATAFITFTYDFWGKKFATN